MVLRGRPAYKARLTRAQFPYPENPFTTSGPLQPATALKRATAVLNNLDSNQDGSLDYSEWMRAPFVPSMVDSNEDRIISLDELRVRYENGAEYARLDLARRDVDVALDRVDTNERPDVLRIAAPICITLSQVSRRQGKSEESEAHLQQARAFAENGIGQKQLDLRFYLLLAEIAVLEGKPDTAETHLKEALELSSQFRGNRQKKKTLKPGRGLEDELQWALADLLFSKMESNQKEASHSGLSLDQKNELTDILKKLNASEPRVKYLKGRMLFAEREWQEASLKLEEARRDLEGNVALRRKLDRVLTICYQRLNNPDAQIAVFRRALREDPVWVDGRVRLGLALDAINRLDDALTEYQSVSFIPGVPKAMAGLLLRKQSALPESRREAGWRNIQRALDAESDLGKKFDVPLSAEVPILRAELQMFQKNYSEAQKILEQYRDENPEETKIWAALSNFHLLNADLLELICPHGRYHFSC